MYVWMIGVSHVSTEKTDPVYGWHNYTMYYPGSSDSRLIISVPHGGSMTGVHDNMPERSNGCWDGNVCTYVEDCTGHGERVKEKCKLTTVTDMYTQEIGRVIYEEINRITGRYPHMIVCNLLRLYMDANRNVEQAAVGNINATKVYEDYHGFIKQVGIGI